MAVSWTPGTPTQERSHNLADQFRHLVPPMANIGATRSRYSAVVDRLLAHSERRPVEVRDECSIPDRTSKLDLDLNGRATRTICFAGLWLGEQNPDRDALGQRFGRSARRAG